MVYGDEFDVTTPSGAELRSQGDDRIRELKRAISERLATIFTNWPDGDPLEIDAAALNVEIPEGFVLDIVAAVPDPLPAEPANLLYVTTEKRLYVLNDVGDAYLSTAALTLGLAAALPNPPTTEFYYATDTNALYVNDGEAYVRVNPTVTTSVERDEIRMDTAELVTFQNPTRLEFPSMTHNQMGYAGVIPDVFVVDEPGVYLIECEIWIDESADLADTEGRGQMILQIEQSPAGGVATYPFGQAMALNEGAFTGSSPRPHFPLRVVGVSFVREEDLAENVAQWFTTLFQHDAVSSGTTGRDLTISKKWFRISKIGQIPA